MVSYSLYFVPTCESFYAFAKNRNEALVNLSYLCKFQRINIYAYQIKYYDNRHEFIVGNACEGDDDFQDVKYDLFY